VVGEAPPGPGGERRVQTFGTTQDILSRGSGPYGGAGSGAGNTMPVGLPPGSEKSAGVMQDDLIHARNLGQEMYPWHEALDAANKLEDKYGKGYFARALRVGRISSRSFTGSARPSAAGSAETRKS
jgi:hypothetical protein